MPLVVFSFACFLIHRSLSVLWASLSNVTSLSHGCTCVRFTMRVCVSVCVWRHLILLLLLALKYAPFQRCHCLLNLCTSLTTTTEKINHLCFALHFWSVSQFDVLCDFLLDSYLLAFLVKRFWCLYIDSYKHTYVYMLYDLFLWHVCNFVVHWARNDSWKVSLIVPYIHTNTHIHIHLWLCMGIIRTYLAHIEHSFALLW